MRRLSFGQKLWIPLILSLVCIVCIAGFGASQTRHARVEERERALKDAGDIAMSIAKRYAAQAAKGAMTEDEARKQTLAALRDLRYGADGYVAVVDNGAHSVMNPFKPEQEGKYLGDFRDANGTYMYREITDVARTTGDGFVDYVWSRPGSEHPVPKRSHVATFQPWGWSFITGAYLDDIDAAFRSSLLNLFGVVAVLAAALASLVFVVNRGLYRSLGGSPDYAARIVAITASGDLNHPIDLQHGDRGSLLFSIREMQGQLRATVGHIVQAANSIAAGTQQIATGNQDLSRRTESQAASLEETAASMEELTSVVKQNADNVGQASGLAAQATTVANRGQAVVSEVVDTMHDISASSKKIGDILGIIEGIAFQTNILALNAAVEAARAGEQGRGFAVVAAEVRSLAQRSSNAAKDIKDLISHSMQRVEAGANLVDQAGHTMGEILAAVQRVTNLMEEIAAASTEQSDGIEQVGRAVTQMDQVTQQNAALVEEAAAAAASMLEQTRVLSRAVSSFKVADSAAS
jgi:methyl-accepting chemotaxis protein